MMQTAAWILAGYLGSASAIAVLWIGLLLRRQWSDPSIKVTSGTLNVQEPRFAASSELRIRN